jgi:CelD/BcsL family acetyltransferase involved in cellulose biosynthesis
MHFPSRSPELSDAAPAASSLAVEEVRDAQALPALAGEWRELSSRAPQSSFFSTWEWTQAWLEGFRGRRRLALLLARSQRRLVGALPLLEDRRGCLPLGPGLELAVNKHSPSASLLHAGDPGPFLTACLSHLERTRGRAAGLRLPLVCADSPTAAAIRELGRGDHLTVAERPGRRSHRIRIRTSWEDYLATRGKHTQREWRRKHRRLEEAGKVEMRVASTAEALPRAMEDVLEIERWSWKHGSGTSFLTEPGVKDFYSRLADLCAQRAWLRLHFLYLDGRPVAHCYAVVYRNELLALKTSFDQRLANLSPGLALMLWLVENAFHEGLAAVDLLGHSDRWKVEMANEEQAYVDLCVYGRGNLACQVCSLMEDRFKPALRHLLPRQLRERARPMMTRLRARR